MLVLLLGVGYAGLRTIPGALPTVESWLGRIVGDADSAQSPSPDLAESTLERVEAFGTEEHPSQLSLGDVELSSVVRFSLPGILPQGVTEPGVRLDDGRLLLSARVATADLPDIPSLGDAIGVLPDTIDIRIRASLLPFDDERVALHVDRVRAMGVPLPDRFTPKILEALGRTDATGLPPDAILVPLPKGIGSAYILRDSLVLVAVAGGAGG